MAIKNIIREEQPFFIASLALVWQILFFYVPLFFIIILSIVRISSNGEFIGLTSENFVHFLSMPYILIIFKSILLALANGLLCFLVGYPVAHFISFKAGKFKNFFLFLLILPFWTNFLLHIYAWFFVLERGGFLNNLLINLGIISKPLQLLNSFWAVMAVMLYCYLPFMVLPIYSILERLNRNLLEASADLGASVWQTWRQVILPLSLSGIKSGFFLVFVPSFGEFAIPGLIGGEKYMFVGTVISQYILGYRTMSLGAAFTILSCTILIIFTILAYTLSKKFFKNL